jgi:hypothetical protein
MSATRGKQGQAGSSRLLWPRPEPWYYDPRLVAKTDFIPLRPGARKHYRQRGYIR